MYQGINEAEKAENHFVTVFQKGTMPDEIPVDVWEGNKEVPIVDLLVELKLLSSKSEARRMIENRGVKLNGSKIEDAQLQVAIKES